MRKLVVLLMALFTVTPTVHVPEHFTIPLGKHWSVQVISGALAIRGPLFNLPPAQQNIVDKAKGIDPDYSGIGAVLRWKMEF